MDVPSTCRQTGLEKGGGGICYASSVDGGEIFHLAMRIMDGYSVVIIYYINIYIMVTTTTAIQIDVTQHILEQSL